jgi:acyl-CoA synthetase (AMP-forming)/AMP-acid ligase II
MSRAGPRFPAARYSSLVGPLQEQGRRKPSRTALVFVQDDDTEEAITVRQLLDQANAWAAAMRRAGLERGDIVILSLRHCLDLAYAFWGALLADAVPAIAVYRNPMAATAVHVRRIADLAARAGARLVITLPDLASEVERSLSGTGCRVLAGGGNGAPRGAAPLSAAGPGSPPPGRCGEDIAYVQFTSGSTGTQKGVRLSHRAILNQIQSLVSSLGVGDEDAVVSWLPLSHDFGLFAGLVMPLFAEIPGVWLSPMKWLRAPISYLRLIQRHRGTISFMPNSAWNHTLRQTIGTDMAGLDLSSLRMLINGSEPVLFESHQEFLERFAPFGFRETALASGYGMAENTLGASCSGIDRRSPVDWVWSEPMQAERKAVPAPAFASGAQPHVSSGAAMQNMEIAVMDEQGRRLPERRLGEIVIRSPSLFSGYHGQPPSPPEPLDARWFGTGDMGYLAEGELYVCGRKKDLIIVGGSNFYPQDLERAAATVPGVRVDRVVALGVSDAALGSERIVLLCSLDRPATGEDRTAMEKEIRQRVHAALDIAVSEIHFVDKNWIRRTANGKIARAENLRKFLLSPPSEG